MSHTPPNSSPAPAARAAPPASQVLLPPPGRGLRFSRPRGVALACGLTGVLVAVGVSVAVGSGVRVTSGVPVACGVATMVFVQAFVNIAVNLGMLPVTGLTLPLVSYGGSSLLTSFAIVGLLLMISDAD